MSSILTDIGTKVGQELKADRARITSIEAATAPQALLTSIKTVDGAGSGLDADKLDGIDSTGFITKDTATGAALMPTGSTAQRPSIDPSGAYAYIRYNNEFATWEGSPDGVIWSGLGGATGGAGNPAFYENDIAVTADYIITTGKNAMSAGPISINNGVTVTIPDGSTWTVV